MKKGVSSVVATVLIILLVILAVGILWISITPRLNEQLIEGDEVPELSIVTIEGYTAYDPIENVISVQVKREWDTANVTGMQIMFFYENGNSESVIVEPPERNSKRVYIFDVTNNGVPVKVSVAPIIFEGGVERIRKSITTIDVPKKDLINTTLNGDLINFTDGEDIRINSSIMCISGDDGSGKINICDCNDLQDMRYSLSASYILGQNIDCSDTREWYGGAGFEPIGNTTNPFTGSLDGAGYEIMNLYINRPGTNFVGLFGIAEEAEISGVTLVQAEVYAKGNAGALVGVSQNSTIYNCSVQGGVVFTTLDYVGCLAGWNYGSTLDVSSSSCNVSGKDLVGGLVGLNVRWIGPRKAIINNSYSSSKVSGVNLTGGLVGSNSGLVVNSYAEGNVQAITGPVGGFVGRNYYSGAVIQSSSWKNYSENPSVGCGSETSGAVGCFNGGLITI